MITIPSFSAPRRRRGTGRLLAVLAAGGLALAACGSDDATAGEAPAARAPATGTPTSAAPAATASSSAAGAMMEPSGPACGAVPADGEGSFAGMADDPAATAASNNPVLSTLVSAVTEAGLVDTLNGDGPFTIFAPTNDAFAALPADQLDTVLADPDLLTSVLTYHVVAGEKLSSADLLEAGVVDTVNGERLVIGGMADALTVNGQKVVCMNVPTANATVHIVDTVLLPS